MCFIVVSSFLTVRGCLTLVQSDHGLLQLSSINTLHTTETKGGPENDTINQIRALKHTSILQAS